MADSVLDRKSSQRRLGKKSTESSSSSNKTSATTTTDKLKQHNNKSSDSQNQSKTKASTSSEETTTANNTSTGSRRESNSRSAKSKALVAISSLLVPTTTTTTQATATNTSRASSTSSTSTTNKRRRRLSSSSTSSIINSHQINNSKIDSTNTTATSSSSTTSSSASSRLNLRSSSKNSNETVFTVNSDITNQTLASTSTTTTSKYPSNKNKTESKSSASKAIPNKRAKLNSDIIDCSTDSSSSVSPVSYSRASLATSATTTTSSANRTNKTQSSSSAAANTNKNKELGNTCNIRSKETGSCVSRSSLRRSRQQQSAETITATSTGTVVATTSNTSTGLTSGPISVPGTQQLINNKRPRNTSNKSSSNKSTTKRGANTTSSSLFVNLNKNMNQQQQSNQNDNSSGLTTTSTSTVPTNTASVTTNSTTPNTLTFSSLFGSRTNPSSTISSFNVSNAGAVGSSSSNSNNCGGVGGTAAAAGAGTSASAATYSFPISESESDDNNADFSRLTDILQARGLPSHIVNAFGSKVQQFLNRTISTGIPSRSQQLIQTLQQNDESLKLTALSELCQLLVMGNEDTLVGFPIKQAVPLLLQCLNSESNNYDLMNHACRALTYMMESLPRSSSAIAEGIPIFLEKLQIIQCMDVAEQALTALEILSRRNSKQILHSNGIAACLTFIDFFSITAQRNALQITANCCQNMIKEEFVHIQSSLTILAQRLTHSDKKSVESVCIIFSRLVETFQHDSVILKEIASHNVLANMQQILVIQPQIISSSIFVLVLHIMYLMCVNCTELAVDLLQNNIADTLKYLLVGSSSSSSSNQMQASSSSSSTTTTTTSVTSSKVKTGFDVKESQQNNFELVNRPPQELYEIVSLIGEIMPKLPQIGIFSIDDTLKKSSSQHQTEQIMWQWKDEREIWRPYTPIDSRIIEASYIQEENEINLSTMGRTYIIDFKSMLQINEETGTARPVYRKVLASTSGPPSNKPTPSTSNQLQEHDNNSTVPKTEPSLILNQQSNNEISNDCRLEYLKLNKVSYADFVRSLFAILYEVYGSSAGPAIKHRCLRALLRMIYYTDESLLNDVLRNLTISSHIASMLASQDLKIIVSALQMSEILMQKLPQIFSIYFLREGVIHQIDRLIETYKPTSNNNNISINSITNMLTFTQPNQPIPASSSALLQQQNSSSLLNTVQPSTSTNFQTSIIQEPITTATNTTNQQPVYKLTPFGMDTIIGSSSNSEVKNSIIQPIIPGASSSSIADEQTEAATASVTMPKQSQSSKQEMKLVETLKRKVRTPKRAGRKGNKSESMEQQSTSANVNYEAQLPTTNILQASSTIESTPAAPSSTSKYVQNMISKIGTNSRSQQAGTSGMVTGTASVAANTTHSKDKTTRSTTNTSTQNPPGSSSATNRSSDFSLFGGHFWSHLRSSNRNNPTSTGTTTATTTTLSNPNSALLSSYKYSASSSRRKGTSSASAAAATSTGPALSNVNTNRPSTSLATTSLTTNTTQQSSNISTANQQIPLINYNKEKVRQWIYEQATQFKLKYFSTALLETTNTEPNDLINHPGLNILKRLNKCVDKLTINVDVSSLNALKEVSNIIYDTDISSFEMIHSGLITKLLEYLVIDSNHSKINRIKQFLQIFIGLPIDEENEVDSCDNDKNNNSNENSNKLSLNKNNLLSNLISKLHNCVNQLEQYTVRVQDVPSSIGYGKTAIKFFNTHQIKCLLQRHQDSATTIRQWKSGPVKIDPLANISAIEKYLIMRGMNKSPQTNESEDDSENSEDDIEDAMSAILGRICESNGPRLELLINDHVLPSNMTIYQAIKQFSVHSDTDNETDTESFTTNKIWSKIHTINYRLASQSQPQTQQPQQSSSSSTNEKRSTRKSANSSNIINSASASTSTNQHSTHSQATSAPSTSRSKRTSASSTAAAAGSNTRSSTQTDDHTHSAINTNQLLSNCNYIKFFDCLNSNWRSNLTIDDQSLNAISLLRILNLLNRNWHLIYMKSNNYNQLLMNYSQINTYLINTSEFVNTKLTAKANRQLQDPLVIMTGHLPKWLPELIKTCQFLFPFETRLMFFYVNSFDRDRAMQKLLDLNSDIGHTLNDGTTSNERIVPKIDRKKKTISRDDILKQSETILNEFGKSKALLEIQYENEVGTGLGPTLEFYALVSLEIQKVDYELWRGDKIKIQTASGTNQNSLFYYSPNGLYPAPLAKNAKQQYVNKVRSKFKFFGKFVAKAIMDFRVLDIQLSMTFYKWLVDNDSLNETDLKYVDTALYRSLDSLKEFLHKQSKLIKRRNNLIKSSPSNTKSDNEIQNEIESIDNELIKLDKSVKDIDLDFSLPGYNHIELKKSGKDLIVSLNNLEEYIKLVTQYTLVDGVQKQIESFIEGFNSIFPITSLQQFYPEELERLFCGSGYDIWDSKLLIECTRCDHGYTHDSKAVQFLFEIMSSYTPDEQRLFLQFVTGSPRLPVGGLRSLVPQLTIVRKTIEGGDGVVQNPDNYLPSVMTCVNYLKLPEYTNVNIMREKLNTAMTEGQLSFNLS